MRFNLISPDCAAMVVRSVDDAKVVMIRSRNYTSLAFIGVLGATIVAAGSTAGAGDIIDGSRLLPASDHCAAFGSDAVDLGNGICGRIGGRTRIEVHSHDANARNASANAWTINGTSSANLRSSDGMVPEASASHHLRVRSGLDSYNPFR